ncbi:hypothetical protein [Streptomyces sp. NRRL B-3648]|uniref:hypothetical protein n=1 Tax=Streptomyces sp. NRRL B-3648 TaxID=1519493 RepID=UPI0006AEEF72|nr:hypothetical protein [Streptomyces sp. NRRL B-3648]KOV94320.1 membrane protein [Streptomyces sp. NRRL B-3648]
MGSLRLTLCTGLLAAAASAAAAPVAHAADGGSVVVTPAVPAPGDDITLRVGGCTGEQGTAASSAFVSDARLTGAQGSLTGETRVRSALTPGPYTVKVTCAGSVRTGTITVTEAGGTGREEEPVEPPAGTASPIAPVPAGGGGTAHFATVATSGTGPDTLQAVTGLALAGIAAVAVGLRARRSRDCR